MGRKSGNLSDEVSQEKAACPCFSKDDVSPSPLEIRACSDRRHTSSETSNPLSVSSSHDSSIENEESKAIPRVSDASEGISMLLKTAVSHAAAEDEGFLEPKFFCGNKTISNQLEMKKVSECNGDDTSCISGPESPNMSGDRRCDIDRKNVSCSSASVSSFLPQGLEKAVDVQIASSVQDSSNYEVKEGHNCSCRPTKFAREQETAPFSGKSEKGEVSSLRDVHNTGAKSLKGDLSECSKEQEKSSFVRVASVTLDGHKHDALDIVESVKPKTEVDEEGDPSTVAKKHLDQNEDLVLHEVPDVQGPQEQSRTVMGSGESDLLIDYKFIVDGEWQHDENEDFVSGNYGVVNTLILLREPDVIHAVYSPETPGISNMDVDHDPFLRLEAIPRISEADIEISCNRVSVFMSTHTAYELLPESGKVIALDVNLPVKQAFHILYEQGIPVAPLWDFGKGLFVGVLSALDFILILRELGNHGSNLTEEELETHTISAWKEGKSHLNRQINGSGRSYPRRLVHPYPLLSCLCNLQTTNKECQFMWQVSSTL